MYAEDDDGQRLDAEYAVERDGDWVALILESRSGGSGSSNARNVQYNPALELLLTRLKALGAVLEDALVDSAHTQRLGLPEDKRRLMHDGPLQLSELPDMAELRRRLTKRQGPIGQRPNARPDGNATKRMRLRLSVPGYAPNEASLLEAALAAAIDRFEYRSADEPGPESAQTFPEGAVTHVMVNKYERDPAARRKCLAAYGHKCSVCGLNFEDHYGDVGKDFIHVHHLKELSTVGAGYEIDPLEDLRPVCPNCHAMLHKRRPAFTPDELRQMLSRSPVGPDGQAPIS